MNETKRESGFYWVESYFGWVIAYYNSRYGFWNVAAEDETFSDDEFTEIDERKITRP